MLSQLDQPSMSTIETTAPDIIRGPDCTDENQSFDTIFRMLENQLRCITLYTLLNKTGPVSVAEIVEELDANPNVEDGAGDIKANLQHRHLPTLEKEGLVEIDQENNLITPQLDSSRLEHLLEYVADESGWD